MFRYITINLTALAAFAKITLPKSFKKTSKFNEVFDTSRLRINQYLNRKYILDNLIRLDGFGADVFLSSAKKNILFVLLIQEETMYLLMLMAMVKKNKK
ncbi:hypothetical protein BDB01DRAFT_852543 [Pilobolus umbonatus]|nr:hypothetical protein BDB01DRAFT_852543 [Pilobolus umbonatus]